MTASRPDSPSLAERASGALLAHAAGNALGLDRLVATCLGAPRIGDVMPFPAAWL